MSIFAIMNIISKMFLYLSKISNNKLFLEPAFLTQIYPFTVSSKGIYSNIHGKEIKFEFSSLMKNKDIAVLKEASISKIISAKEKQIAFLQKKSF